MAHPVLILATIALVAPARRASMSSVTRRDAATGAADPGRSESVSTWSGRRSTPTSPTPTGLTAPAVCGTDLGGFYFNGIYIRADGRIYAASGFPPLPLVVLLIHVDVLQQLLPLVRVDGYFILADRMACRPVQPGGAYPRQPIPAPEATLMVAHLKRRARVIIIAWLLVTIPLLIGFLALFLIHLPSIYRTGPSSDKWTSPRRRPAAVMSRLPRSASCPCCYCCGPCGYGLGAEVRSAGVASPLGRLVPFRPQTHLLLGRLFYLGGRAGAGGLPGGRNS